MHSLRVGDLSVLSVFLIVLPLLLLMMLREVTEMMGSLSDRLVPGDFLC